MSSSREKKELGGRLSSVSLRTTRWPLVGDRLAVATVVLLVLLVADIVAVETASWTLAGTCLAAMLLSTWRMWLPISWEFGPAGVTQRVLRHQRIIPWKRFSRYEVFDRGVLLLQHNDPGPLARLGAVFIDCGNQRDDVLSVLDYYIVRVPRF